MPSPTASKDSIALAAVCLTSLMFGLEISSVPTVLATLQSVLHADFSALQWVMNAYTLACTTVLMATGALADRFGRKAAYVVSIVVFAAMSLACGFARSADALIICRFFQGMGGGAMLICQIAVLSHQFQDGRARSQAFAMWGIVFGIGLGFGPAIGGIILATASWPWIFLVHVAGSITALGLVLAGVRESRDPQAQRLDLPGIVTLGVSSFGLVYLITLGPSAIGANPLTSGLAVVTIVAFIAFLFVERRNPHPMFDFSVLRIRPFSGALFGSMGMNFSYWPFMIYLPIYFQGVLRYSSLHAGLALLAYTLPTLVVPPLAERLMLRIGARRVIPLGLATIGMGFLVMRWGAGVADASWITMLPGCLVCGTGLGLTNTPVTNTTTGSVSPNRAGMASGIDMSARLISLAINIALMGLILLEAVYGYLAHTMPGQLSATTLRTLAEQIASGDTVRIAGTDPAGVLVRASLAHGFAQVMAYGAIGALTLAVLSLATFGFRARLHCDAARLDRVA